MIPQTVRRIDEMAQYVEHTCNQIVRDSKTVSHVSLGELNTDSYQLALHHLHVALAALHTQQEVSQQYLISEEEKEQVEAATKSGSKSK